MLLQSAVQLNLIFTIILKFLITFGVKRLVLAARTDNASDKAHPKSKALRLIHKTAHANTTKTPLPQAT